MKVGDLVKYSYHDASGTCTGIIVGFDDDNDPIVRDNEPSIALNGGIDGLDSINCVVDKANIALSPGGWLLLEHQYDQSESVLRLLRKVNLRDVSFAFDYEGIKRFAMARKSLK